MTNATDAAQNAANASDLDVITNNGAEGSDENIFGGADGGEDEGLEELLEELLSEGDDEDSDPFGDDDDDLDC